MKDIEKFIHGFSRFQQLYLTGPGRFETLREGQKPPALVIGCCDSRVEPVAKPDVAIA